MNEDEFDKFLQRHLADELNGQVGRTSKAFARESHGRWRIAALAGMAIAAGVAAIFLMPRKVAPTQSTSPHGQIAQAIPANIEYTVTWQTVDQGTVLVDDQPMQNLQSERTDHLQWVDPATHAAMELTIPQDETVLIGLTSY